MKQSVVQNTGPPLVPPLEACLPWVRGLAHNVGRAKLLSGRLEADDLLQEGAIGLLQAQARFNPQAGCQFSTFAFYRVRGAMLSALRKERTIASREVHVENLQSLPSPGVSEETAVYGHDLPVLVQELPEADQALVMGHLEGESFSTLGQRLGLAKPTAFAKHQAALKELRQRLEARKQTVKQQRRRS